ncbi:hypothetical protein G0Q06_13905 [Puniceicoccales bacterium CK1056]|uniref:Ig-like domain-containing protein n=1 Tax=Oceanipulchritudo coccoides TaxID=2706888 RepID=A0A6B2M619_9BACT|nr:GEVED domain-containing protein [Oceanipulchritudo coccoides]NDV63554.1 hypothetical protein [Oceanipulchritudo coccoides]
MEKIISNPTHNLIFNPTRHMLLAGLLMASSLFAADFGDAPDGTDAFYPVFPGNPAIIGQFPTLLASDGARHADLTDCWLGGPGSAPSSEADANDGSDPDGLANLVNNDAGDEGLPVIPFYLDLDSATATATVTVRVTVPEGAPDLPRTLNMLVDWDQSGDWKNPGTGEPEWVIQNYSVNVTPGSTQLLSIPITWGMGADIFPQVFWTRLTLTRSTITATIPADGWDGSGSFAYGETEDFLFHPNARHDAINSPWSAPMSPAPGTVPDNPPPSISLTPSNQSVPHGTLATVLVNLDTGVAPDSLEWAIDPAQRGSSTFDPGLSQQAFGGSYSVSGSTATATSGGTLPTLGSITVSSVVDSSTPAYEEWPIRVRARWDGFHTQTARTLVRIWHDGWSGTWAITTHFEFLLNDISATVPAGQQATALGHLAAAKSAYVNLDLSTSTSKLGDLDTELASLATGGHITSGEETRLRGTTTDLITAINALDPFGFIIPILASPVDGEVLTGTVPIASTTDSPGAFGAVFSYSTDGSTWVEIGDGVFNGGQYITNFDTTGVPDGMVRLKVLMFDFDIEFSGEYEAIVWVDNSAPTPTLSTPVAGSTHVGIIPVQVDTDTGDDLTTLLELSRNGTDWYAIGTDSNSADGHTTLVDSGQLPAGSYSLRATATDAFGNTAQDSWSFNVAPSFHAWRIGLGLPTAETDEDLDQDGLSLGEEYYFGLSATTPEVASDYLLWESLGGSNFQFRFTPGLLVDGLRAAVEGSPDLATWGDLLLDPDNSAEVVVPVDTSPRQFVRLNLWEDRP